MKRDLSSNDVARAVALARASGERIPDDVAAVIASYWHSPGPRDREITMISHGVGPITAEDYRAAAETMRGNRERGTAAGHFGRTSQDVAECVAFEFWARGKADEARQ